MQDGVEPIQEFDVPYLSYEEGNGAERLERDEELRVLRSVIENLSRPLREAFVVTVLDGYTYQEAAELLSVPVGTIGSRVYEARRLIAAKMHEQFPEV